MRESYYAGRRRRKKRRKVGRYLFIVASAIVIAAALLIFTKKEELRSSPKVVETEINMQSPYGILIEVESGNVLAEKNSAKKICPASLTKIMTAIVAIENIQDLQQTIFLPGELFQPLYDQGASMAGFQPGDANIEDLLYGVILPSGAECCQALAGYVSGTEEAFADKMNQKASELGMKGTNFANSTGLQRENHYSTVEDISKLLKYALKNDVFHNIFTSSSHATKGTYEGTEGFTFYSTLFENMDTNQVTGGEILGGKTGYTDEAGLCLASLAVINGKEYIFVSAGAIRVNVEDMLHIQDAKSVYNQLGSYLGNNSGMF